MVLLISMFCLVVAGTHVGMRFLEQDPLPVASLNQSDIYKGRHDMRIGSITLASANADNPGASRDVDVDEAPIVVGDVHIGPLSVLPLSDDEGVELKQEDEIVLAGGVRIGSVTFMSDEPDTEDVGMAALGLPNSGPPSSEGTVDSKTNAPKARRSRRRAVKSRASVPRLHQDPGRHTIMVARRFMNSSESFQGSCYRYLSEVFARAGHGGWRDRRIVYRAERDGPYANLNMIRPGDWLYIVNDPSRTPVGTHSVLFLSWYDRSQGIANTISHAGWYASGKGRQRTYDISRTYRIIRPISAEHIAPKN